MCKKYPIALSLLCVGLSIAGESHAADYSSPKAALKSLEAAYVARDLESAVGARDFAAEAQEMLTTISKGDASIAKDPGILKQTAEVLEKAYRLEMKSKGFPPMETLKCDAVEEATIRERILCR